MVIWNIKNESLVKVGKTKEGLKSWLSGFWANFDYLDSVRGHGEAFRDRILSEVFAGSDMEFAFVCMAKSLLATRVCEVLSDVSLMFSNVVRVDEDVIQIDDDNHVNHVRERCRQNCWKATGELVSPSGIY